MKLKNKGEKEDIHSSEGKVTLSLAFSIVILYKILAKSPSSL